MPRCRCRVGDDDDRKSRDVGGRRRLAAAGLRVQGDVVQPVREPGVVAQDAGHREHAGQHDGQHTAAVRRSPPLHRRFHRETSVVHSLASHLR